MLQEADAKNAEGEGFEPPVPQDGTLAFQASPFDRSGTPPWNGDRNRQSKIADCQSLHLHNLFFLTLHELGHLVRVLVGEGLQVLLRGVPDVLR